MVPTGKISSANIDFTDSTRNISDSFILTQECIDNYLQMKADQGVAPAAIAKYRTPLVYLLGWMGEHTEITLDKLLAWRESLVQHGYGKVTVQNYVTVVNTFLRTLGHPDICIPKPQRNDLRGQTFGYLTVIEPTDNRHHKYITWRCKCRCGNEVEIPSSMLLRGCTTSCGCLNVEILQHSNRYEEGTELRKALEEKVLNPDSQSGYVGIQSKRNKWVAHITYKKKKYYLGTFNDIEDAIKARARAKEAVMEDAARIYEETAHLYGESPRRPPRPAKISVELEERAVTPARRGDNTSGYPGVVRSKDKWSSSISVNKFRYRLGAYDELGDAVAARKQAEALVAVGDLETLKTVCTNWNK